MKAPATFQRLMDIVLAGLKWQCCLAYIEDHKYLGHVITNDGVKPDPELISSVKEFPQSMLGLTGYCRRFIQNYAKIAEPLLKQIRNT
ncbi:unnamed protein product [Rotaria magnacalcarata]|uniref:Reverse transcriptase n=2 Tax=Rotaria magnacalcarata TaxID=392030 RepID=A0A8S3K3R6_9BILA|nr:unnamed protein product [Rotaria magnacalcarata]